MQLYIDQLSARTLNQTNARCHRPSPTDPVDVHIVRFAFGKESLSNPFSQSETLVPVHRMVALLQYAYVASSINVVVRS